MDGGRLPAHSHGYGHGVAVVKAALDVSEGLEPHALLSRVSKLYRSSVDVSVHPTLGRLIGDHACHAFHVGISAKELGEAHDKGFHPVVPAEFTNIFGPSPKFRQHRARGVGNLQLGEEGFPQPVQHGRISLL